MTCKDIMTPNPACCVPGDTVSVAAQIMKQEDVGPVLVVSDQSEKRLVGILTDRDVAVKVVADNRDPHTTRVDEVMSLSPVCCREDEPTSRALQLMANHQVRRIPIVDEQNRLSGIVAQADVALHEDEEEVGRVVEHISEPYGSAGWADSAGRKLMGSSDPGSLASGALCLAIGAGLMYVLDPSRGPVRRNRIQAKGSKWYASSTEALGGKASDLRNRAAGVVASAKSRLQHEDDVPDKKLVSRIRSRLGHSVPDAHAVEVQAWNGAVTLSGPILAEHVRTLIDCVDATPGVRTVESRLDVYETSGSHPGLQRSRVGGEDTGLGTSFLIAMGIAGGAVLMYGLRSKAGHFEEDRSFYQNISGAQGY